MTKRQNAYLALMVVAAAGVIILVSSFAYLALICSVS